jgi:hypothetical protein
MNILGYPIEIWIAGLIGVFIRLQTSNRLTLLGATTTVIVAMAASLILHGPIVALLGLSVSWNVPVAVIIALTAENLMKAFVEISADKEWIKGWIRHLVDKKTDNNNEQ